MTLWRENNTKFFHASVVFKRARNKVTKLKDEGKNWIEDPELIKELVFSFYKKLYTGEESETPSSRSWNFPTLKRIDICLFRRYVSALEPLQVFFPDSATAYLGIPLFHQRVGNKTFGCVIEKVRRKLSGWKARMLSEAFKAILI
ncbi:hypothetical protein M9H77_24055 [Catharanthus roseus]|uniref:Uncharacterized protein n=1 Tax=Catharanthus roseus TaxID=4058 RepID=A0ACC0AW91_CATRO|nr:hypothetical protein M9H77_24055 [Catharanthus roseus]